MKVVVDEIDRIGMKVDFKIIEVIGGGAKKKVVRNFARKKQGEKKGGSAKGSRKDSERRKTARKSARKNADRRRR